MCHGQRWGSLRRRPHGLSDVGGAELQAVPSVPRAKPGGTLRRGRPGACRADSLPGGRFCRPSSTVSPWNLRCWRASARRRCDWCPSATASAKCELVARTGAWWTSSLGAAGVELQPRCGRPAARLQVLAAPATAPSTRRLRRPRPASGRHRRRHAPTGTQRVAELAVAWPQQALPRRGAHHTRGGAPQEEGRSGSGGSWPARAAAAPRPPDGRAAPGWTGSDPPLWPAGLVDGEAAPGDHQAFPIQPLGAVQDECH